MNPTQADVDRAVDVARRLQQQGYFAKAKTGDEKAASYFARMVASTVNPTGKENDWGWLLKPPGTGHHIEGYADGAIVFGNDPRDLKNVLKIVTQVGSHIPNDIQVGSAVQDRRSYDVWIKPVPLPSEIPNYIQPAFPIPPEPPEPDSKPYPGDPVWDAVGEALFADYARAGQAPNPQMGRWFGRTIWDATEGDATGTVLSIEASIEKHRKEWRAILGLP